MSDKDYKVGYGKPPKSTRFRKGQSGNPRGRPKGARGFKTDLRAELSEKIRVIENGRTHWLTKQRVIIKTLIAQAAKGDTRSIAKVVDLELLLFGAEGDQSAAGRLSVRDDALIAEFLLQGLANGEDPGD